MENQERVPVDGLFSIRTRNCLLYWNENIRYIDEVANISSEDLMNLRHFGKKSLNELRNVLDKYGFTLRDEKPLSIADQRNFLIKFENEFGKMKRRFNKTKKELLLLEKTIQELTIMMGKRF